MHNLVQPRSIEGRACIAAPPMVKPHEHSNGAVFLYVHQDPKVNHTMYDVYPNRLTSPDAQYSRPDRSGSEFLRFCVIVILP